MTLLRHCLHLSAIYFCLLSTHVQAEQIDDPALLSAALPDPLSLPQALKLAGRSHPDLELANGLLEQAYARKAIQDADLGLQVNLELKPQIVKLTGNGDIIGDSYVELSVSKKLYDFGYSDALALASATEIAQYQHLQTQSYLQHQLKITQNFYDVLLADLRYTYENEEMSQLFVKYDRLRERFSLGIVTETEILKAKNLYQEQLDIRTASDHQRRLTRQTLALNLNRPDQLPGNLIAPNLSSRSTAIPEFSELYATAVKSNPGLMALRENVKTKQEELHAQRAQFNPTLSALVGLNEYERSLSSRSDIQVGLQLSVPLYLGGKQKAVNQLAYANFLASQHELRRAEYSLREQILALLSRLATLKTEQRTAIERITLQDQELDRQRAIYELEIKATMGSAMARLTYAEWQAARVKFEIALTRAQINTLLGKPL